MMFEILHPVEKIKIVNTMGNTAICTLWTPIDVVYKELCEEYPIPETMSPVAVIGNLYGGGLKILIRNLAYNPQIERILIHGRDLSGSGEALEKYLKGCYTNGPIRKYATPDGLRDLNTIVISTKYRDFYLPDLYEPSRFVGKVRVVNTDQDKEMLKMSPDLSPHPFSLPREVLDDLEPFTETRSCEILGSQVVGKDIAEAWAKSLRKILKFGRKVKFRDLKTRLELPNLKVVVKTVGDLESLIPHIGADAKTTQEYLDHLLNPELSVTESSYTYGNRMRRYFGTDAINSIIDDIRDNALDSRHLYVNLWDNTSDINSDKSPCLVSLFFRMVKRRLDLTVSFRSHNLSRAWPWNCIGMFGLLEHVAENGNCEAGSLIVNSLSATFNLDDLNEVQSFLDANPQKKFNLDPNGHFQIRVEDGHIKVIHTSPEGNFIKEYVGVNDSSICTEIYLDEAISDIKHAMYVSRQLAKAKTCLRQGSVYVQDDSTIKVEDED